MPPRLSQFGLVQISIPRLLFPSAEGLISVPILEQDRGINELARSTIKGGRGMDTDDKICMWCSKAILMQKEESAVFKGILLSGKYSEREKRMILNAIEFIEKTRDP